MNFSFPFRSPPGNLFACWRRISAGVLLLLLAAPAPAQDAPPLPSASDLKKLRVDELMNIEVTSVSKHPEKLFEAASAIQVVTAEEVRRSGATSLAEALRLTSNLEVAQIDSRQWAVTARGFNNVFADKMLVLIDGRTVYTPLYAGVYWDVQDVLLQDLDRIEVISGPGATQWGANAVNGVINITTKSARDTTGGLVSVADGDLLEETVAARYGGEIAPGVYYRIYGKYTGRGDSFRPYGQEANDDWDIGQGGFRVDWDASVDNHLTVQGDAYAGTFGRTAQDDITASGRNLLGRWTRTLGEKSEVRVQLYYDHTHRVIPQSFTQTLDTYDFDFQRRFPIGETHDVLWGFGYRVVDDDIVNTPVNAFLPAQVTRQVFSAFAQDEMALAGGRLHVTFGTKLEHNDYTGFELQPSIRAAWTPAKTQTVWAAISRAVRVPSRIDRDLFSPAVPPFRIAGGPGVDSENLRAYELGYRLQPAANVELSVAAFCNLYDDLRSLEPLNPPALFPVELSSGLRGRSTGAEFTAQWQVTPSWQLRAGYTELRVHTEPQPGTVDRGTDRTVAHDPNHQALLRSSFDLGARWELDATFRYIGAISNQRVPGYGELDVRLGWRPTRAWELALSGRNLLHDQHSEFNIPGSRREIGRSVYGQATWHF